MGGQDPLPQAVLPIRPPLIPALLWPSSSEQVPPPPALLAGSLLPPRPACCLSAPSRVAALRGLLTARVSALPPVPPRSPSSSAQFASSAPALVLPSFCIPTPPSSSSSSSRFGSAGGASSAEAGQRAVGSPTVPARLSLPRDLATQGAEIQRRRGGVPCSLWQFSPVCHPGGD